MKETKTTNNATDETAQDSRLEAVRDLLFGQNDQEYRKEFKEIHNKIGSKHEDASERIEKLREEQRHDLSKLEERLNARIEQVETSLAKQLQQLDSSKVERKKLAAILQQMAKELES